MGLIRRKPFTLLFLAIAIVLLVLACTTAQNACYDQLGFQYGKIDDDASNYCAAQCDGDVASKKIAFIDGQQGTAIPGELFDAVSNPAGLKRVIRCSWGGTTRRLFLACACLMVVWAFLELFLAAKRKYPFILNIILILVLGLGIPTAIYQLSDIHDRTCNPITFPDDNGDLQQSNNTQCYQSLYNVSFILTIVAMVLLLAQLIYNVVRRKAINEEDPKYAGIPQGTNPTHDNVAPVINPDAERLQ